MNENPISNPNSTQNPGSTQLVSPTFTPPTSQPGPVSGANGIPGAFQPINTMANEDNSKWWRTTVGVICIVAVIAIVVGAAIFGLTRIIGGPNYGESYQLANELYEQLDEAWGSRTTSCTAMVNEENDSSVDSSTYKNYVEECRKDLSEIRDTAGKLGQSSGVKHDDKLKQRYKTFEDAMNAALPDKSNVDKMAKIFTAVHEFAIRLNDISSDSNEADIHSAAALLTGSGSKNWASYGQEWETKMLQYVRAYKAYNNASYSDSRYNELRQTYSDARDELQQHLRNVDSETWDNGGLNTESFDAFEDAFLDLKTSIRETYETHYDGKNEKYCIDLGDGEASCD